jgi:hypothetical protein
MPVLYEIDLKRSLVRTTCAGSVTFEQVMAHFGALERDPRRAARVMDVIIDIRTLTSMPETSQLRQTAERISPDNTTMKYGRLAVVAVNPEAVGLGRLFAEFTRGRFTASTVVDSIGEAERWLDSLPALEAAG